MLDLTKKLQTRYGLPVEIKFTDGRSKTHPICGYIDNQTIFSFWTPEGIWAGCASPENDLINISEWHLPDPPEGYEWHRTDWTKEMLLEGWRPLLLGEFSGSGDGIYSPAKKNESHQRTCRPLPPPKLQLREVPLCADDVPPFTAFRFNDKCTVFPLCISDDGVGFPETEPCKPPIQKFSYALLMELGATINRSIPVLGKWDASAWEPCSKTKEVLP